MGDNYTSIERPYDNNMERSAGLVSQVGSEGEVGTYVESPVDIGKNSISGQAFSDMWIETWIKSRNYKPKTQGFLIDGQQGYIECMKLFAGSGGIVGGKLDVPDEIKANSFHVDADGNMWLGCNVADFVADNDNALAYILKTGIGKLQNIDITGGTIGGSTVANVGYVATTTADAVPSGLTVSSTGISTGSDGTQSAYVVLTWTAIATNTFDYYVIRYKKAALTYYIYINSKTNNITIEGLTSNVAYNFGIASVNKFGQQSAFSADVNQTAASDTTAPSTVTSGSATGGIQYVIVEWTHNSDSDLSYYNVYRNTSNDSATATKIGSCKTNYFIDGGRTGNTAYYYWVKAVDTSGNESAAFSTVMTATPRNVTNDDIVTIAGSKVLIDGVVYLSNWQKSGDLTKIDGGAISANTITTTQLNFTPVQTGNIIATINSSTEGITIEADNLTISAATTFVAGYDPSTKTAAVGGTYDSAASGARVRIFPDANTGIQVIDDGAADVFKVIVGGTNVGDVVIGNYAGGQGIFYDKSAGTTTFYGTINATDGFIGGVADGIQINSDGVEIIGDGYIRTNSSGARIELVKNLTGGYTSVFRAIDGSENEIFTILCQGAASPITMNAFISINNRFYIQSNTSADEYITLNCPDLSTGIKIATEGNSNRYDKGAIYVENYSQYGHGIYLMGGENSIDSLLRLGTYSPKQDLLEINNTSFAAVQGARITNKHYIQFPADYFYSEFDERLSGNTAIASTVIANAQWAGSGTNGTQILITGDVITPIELSTTSTANSTSILTSGKQISNANHACFEARVRLASNTNTKILFGLWYSDSRYICFKFDTDVHATNIYAECIAGGSATTTDTAVDRTAYYALFRIQVAYPAVYFYINDALVATITTNASFTDASKAYFYINNKAVAQENFLYVDFVKMWQGRDWTDT